MDTDHDGTVTFEEMQVTLRRLKKYGLFKFSRNVASAIAAATQSKCWCHRTECQLREQIGTSRFVRARAYGHDMRSLAHHLGHRNLQSTARYQR